MDIRTFCFCLDVCEDESLSPIYGDYLEDMGLPRHHAMPHAVMMSLAAWMSHYWRWVWLEPIQCVTLTDRAPYHNTWATWLQPFTPADLGDLPNVIIRYLRGGEVRTVAVGAIVRYDSDIAVGDASQALIAWARDKVRQELGECMVC